MPKRAEPLDRPNGWAWVCDLAAKEGIDLGTMSLSEAAEYAVSFLEHRIDSGLPLSPGVIRLASLLVRLEGESAVSGTSSGEVSINRAYARDFARLLAHRYATGLRILRRQPKTPEPEPEPPAEWTLHDLLLLSRSLAREGKRWRARRVRAGLR